MNQPPCQSIEETIQKLRQDLYTIEDQLQVLSDEGMEQLNPSRYIVLQQQVDCLVKKKLELQDALNQAMDDLVRCKSDKANQSSQSSPNGQ
jgi:hypothetical protein